MSQPLLSSPTTFPAGTRDVFEEHLVEVGVAVDLRQRPHGHAGALHVDQQERDALCFGASGSVRTRHMHQSA